MEECRELRGDVTLLQKNVEKLWRAVGKLERRVGGLEQAEKRVEARLRWLEAVACKVSVLFELGDAEVGCLLQLAWAALWAACWAACWDACWAACWAALAAWLERPLGLQNAAAQLCGGGT